MRAGMHDEEWESEIGSELNFLDQRLNRFVAVVRGGCAEINQITGVPKHAAKAALVQFIRILGKVGGCVRF